MKSSRPKDVRAFRRSRAFFRETCGLLRSPFRQMSRVDDFLQHLFGVTPQLVASVRNPAVASDDTIVGYTVTVPSGALRTAVQKHWLKPIDRGRKSRLCRFLRFELIP